MYNLIQVTSASSFRVDSRLGIPGPPFGKPTDPFHCSKVYLRQGVSSSDFPSPVIHDWTKDTLVEEEVSPLILGFWWFLDLID
jgi:hypothetical protein